MAESLFLNKKKIDLYSKPITRKIQIGEVSQVTERRSSYSYTIRIPKTSNNKLIFDMLGTQGNTSRKPFEQIVADYIVDSVYLVLNGSVIIRETSTDYQVNIVDGVRSLGDLLKGKKLIDLPLEDLNHILSTQEYVDSYENTEGYIYGIANYGRGASSSLKVEEQAPSIYTHTLFRRIFESSALSLQGEFFTTNEKYLNEVLTPARGYEVEFAQLTSTPKGGADSNTLSYYEYSNEYFTHEEKFTMSNNGIVGASVVGGDIVFSIGGTYRVDLSVIANLYETYGNIVFKINGVSKSYISLREGSNVKTKKIVFAVEAGDVVSFYISASSSFDYYEYQDEFNNGFRINYTASFGLSLYLQEGGQVIKASDYIGDMNQLDFIKDVINRYGLVLHPVQNTNEYRFRRIEAILNDRANAEDWTSKLSSINSENYNSGYAKINKANFQYPDSIVIPNNDGEMLVDNENAEDERTIFSSPFEIPAQSSGSVSSEKVYLLPIWGEESQENVEVETELNNDEELNDTYLKTDGSLYVPQLISEDSVFADSYIRGDGLKISGFPNYNVKVYNVSQDDTRRVLSRLTGGDIAIWAFYSDSDLLNLVSVGDVHQTGTVTYNRAFAVPAGANYAAITEYKAEYADLYEYLPDWIVRKYEDIDPTNKTYKATGRVEYNDNAFVCFYDVNDNFISYQYKGSGSEYDRTKNSLYIPSNCKIIRGSGKSDFLPTLFQYEDITITTAVNEETPLKVMHINRLDKTITAKFYDEVTGITVSENVPFLNLDFISLQYVLGNYYKAFRSLIDNYKKVNLSINLGVVDIFNIDFFSLKYFRQTGRFYYLNSIQDSRGKLSKVEALEILEFPQNQPPSQIGDYSFNMNHGTSRVLTIANLSTGYEDPELDQPLKVKIISGFNSNVLIKQNGVTITSETEILVEDLALSVEEVLGGLDAYVEQWVFAIADTGSGKYGDLTGLIIANVKETINQPPVARAGDDIIDELLPDDYPYDIFISLNGSASYDYTGDIVSYIWTIESQPINSEVTISGNGSSAYGSLNVPSEAKNIGDYTIRLTVTDEYGASDYDEMTVTVNDYDPKNF